MRSRVRRILLFASGKTWKDDGEVEAFLEGLPAGVASFTGGNTPCVQWEIPDINDELVVFDAGSGLRLLGEKWRSIAPDLRPQKIHLFLSHLHWDHLQGLPFFLPLYDRDVSLVIHGCHKSIPDALERQMSPPFFPVPFGLVSERVEFDLQEPGSVFDLGRGRIVKTIVQNHPGMSLGFRCEAMGKTFVYSSDCEHKEAEARIENYPFIDFFQNADLLIADAQYSYTEARFSKADWGHSSNIAVVDLAARAKVNKLILFHHDPASSDELLADALRTSYKHRDQTWARRPEALAGGVFPREIHLGADEQRWVL